MDVDRPIPENCNMGTKHMGSDEDMFANSQEYGSTNKPQDNECFNKESMEAGPSIREDSSDKVEASSKDDTWRGTHISKLKKNKSRDQFPPVAVTSQHTVLFKLPLKADEIPQPWPEKAVDKWDQNHVRLPHSPSSLYPVTQSELQPRWQLVRQALGTFIATSHQLESAILHYNSMYSDRWHFHALHSFFSQVLEDFEAEYFFENLLPKIVELALRLPQLVTHGIPLLRQHRTHSISLTQQQISSLLANAFLCTFPRRNTSKKNSEYASFPDINFNRLFSGQFAEEKGRIPCIHEKLKCLINYFKRVSDKMPDGVVTFSRHHVPPNELPMWSQECARFTNMYVSSTGTIEDDTSGMLQVDFANKMVGGGVLGNGCVQEEIRFVICPELILSRLFTEVLDDTEALVVTGCERFSSYSGYSNDFEWRGGNTDNTPKDRCGRRYCTVVAIDAFSFPNAKTQYSAENINRELNKAYAGFSWGVASGSTESIATGNWGCGAFKGDPYLKTLIQLMAAAKTRREVAYFTFGNTELRDKLADMHHFLVKQQVTVGDLWKIITRYNPAANSYSLYDFIYQAFSNNLKPSPLSTKTTFVLKKQRVKENVSKVVQDTQPESTNGHPLNTEEIEKALATAEDAEEETDSVRAKEAKSLSLHKDKELCLKRLNSSWSNLNHSKRDFGAADLATKSDPATEADTSLSSKQSSSRSRKKKISDYFQPASKS